jgi:hypothetical protein
MNNSNQSRRIARLARMRAIKRAAGLLLLVTASAGWGLCAQAQAQDGVRTYEVAWSVVGVETLPSDAALGQGFVEALSGRPGTTPGSANAFNIRGLKPGAGVWGAGAQGRAAGAEPLSVVNVSVGKHRDLLAFVMDEKGTTVLAALRRECLIGRKTRRDWAGPGPYQIPENAVRELAQDFGHLSVAALKLDEARRVSVSAVAWKTAASDLAGGFVDAPAPPGAKGGESAPMEASGSDGVQAVNALAFAALAQAGGQPTSQAVDASLTVEVARNIDHYALRYTLKRDGKTQQYVQRFIPQSELFDHIAVAARKLWAWRDDVRSVAKLGDGAAEPLAAGKGVTVIGVGGAIRGFEPVSGRDAWPAFPAKRPGFSYASIPVGAETRVIRLAKPNELIDIQSGRATPIAGDAPTLPWGMDLLPNGRAAVVADNTVSFHDGAKELWKITFADPITAGPGISDRAVFVGNEAGDLVSLSSTDGKELWRQPTGLRLQGPITLLGDSLILGSVDGTVLALSPSDGKPIWRHAAKDVLISRPILIDGRLLLADKGNTIWLLDPKTGQPKATYSTPTWLINAVLIQQPGKNWIACTDLHGSLRFLSLPDLKPIREIPLATDLTKPILLAPDLPTIWAGANEIDQKTPAVLVGDRKGWVYLVELPK